MTATIGDVYENPTKLMRAHAVTAPQKFPLRQLVESHGDVIGPLCRSAGVDPEAMLAQLWIASQKSPDMLKATPETLLPAIARGIQLGGVFGVDYSILTFKNRTGKTEAAGCVDYKFLAQLIIAAGGARSIDVQVIYEGDVFREVMGSEPKLIHEPPPFGQKRGRPIGAYAIAHLGATVPPRWKAMTLAEIEVVRAKSKQWNREKVGDAPLWYLEKTPLRRLAKLLPQNEKMRAVLDLVQQDAAHDGDDEVVVAGPLEEAPSEPVRAVSPELAHALAFTVKGVALGDMDDEKLAKLRQWAVEKGNDRVASMCALVQADRVQDAAAVELDLEEVPE